MEKILGRATFIFSLFLSLFFISSTSWLYAGFESDEFEKKILEPLQAAASDLEHSLEAIIESQAKPTPTPTVKPTPTSAAIRHQQEIRVRTDSPNAQIKTTPYPILEWEEFDLEEWRKERELEQQKKLEEFKKEHDIE